MGEGDGELGDDRGLLEEVPATGRPGLALPTGRDKRAWLLLGRRAVPPTSHLRPVEPPRPGKVGICCSGGGIRSAAFNLGALQALQAAPTIAAGRRLPGRGVGRLVHRGRVLHGRQASTRPAATTLTQGLRRVRPPFHPGSPEEQYLRNRARTWRPAGSASCSWSDRVLRGLVLNLLFMAVAGRARHRAGTLVYRPLYGSLADPGRSAAPSGRGRCGFAADVPEGFKFALLFLGIADRRRSTGSRCCCCGRAKDFWRRGFETWADAADRWSAAALAVVVIVIPVLADGAARLRRRTSGGQAAETASAPGLPAVGAGSFATVLAGGRSLQLRARAAEPGDGR